MLAAGVGGQSERLAGHRRKMAVESRVTQEEIKKEPEKPIDREKVRRPDEVAVGWLGGERGLRAGGGSEAAAPAGGWPRCFSLCPCLYSCPPDVPAAAARLHHQQRPPSPHGRVLPRERAVQRAADLHLVSGPRDEQAPLGRWGAAPT